jgi:hypothetical protein
MSLLPCLAGGVGTGVTAERPSIQGGHMSNGMSIKNEKQKKERWIKERLMKFLKYESNMYKG